MRIQEGRYLQNALHEVMEPARSEWPSPIAFVQKKDGSLRFCTNYRKLNVVPVKGAYPILRIEECFDSLVEARIFWALETRSGYWQIKSDGRDKDKTTFRTHYGLY